MAAAAAGEAGADDDHASEQFASTSAGQTLTDRGVL